MISDPFSRKDLRLAGVSLAIVLAGLGLLELCRNRSFFPFLFAASALALITATFFPSLLRPLMRVVVAVGSRVVRFTTWVILVLVYFFLVTPTAVIGRLLGATFADVDFLKRKPSYWIKKEERPKNARDYEKQY